LTGTCTARLQRPRQPALALAKAAGAQAVVLVEGVSDQIAVETLAALLSCGQR
jgi:hypothetical protein